MVSFKFLSEIFICQIQAKNKLSEIKKIYIFRRNGKHILNINISFCKWNPENSYQCFNIKGPILFVRCHFITDFYRFQIMSCSIFDISKDTLYINKALLVIVVWYLFFWKHCFFSLNNIKMVLKKQYINKWQSSYTLQ